MSTRTYVAAVYPRFNGLYYTVRYLDFNDHRGNNLEPEQLPNAEKLLQKKLQALINKMKRNGESVPEPSMQSYDYFQSSYDDECSYVKVTVKV